MSDDQPTASQTMKATVVAIVVIVGLAILGGIAFKELLDLPSILGQAVGLGIGYFCSRALLRRILS